jgi:hypothetical protein
MPQHMSIRIYSKKKHSSVYLLGCQHQDPNSTARKFVFGIFAVQRINGTEPFAPNTFLC